MKRKPVMIKYIRKQQKFLYENVIVGGPHYMKDEIAELILMKLPKRKLSAKREYKDIHVNIKRLGKTTTYIVSIVA